jgi:hypothetical protein
MSITLSWGTGVRVDPLQGMEVSTADARLRGRPRLPRVALGARRCEEAGESATVVYADVASSESRHHPHCEAAGDAVQQLSADR